MFKGGNPLVVKKIKIIKAVVNIRKKGSLSAITVLYSRKLREQIQVTLSQKVFKSGYCFWFYKFSVDQFFHTPYDERAGVG